MLLSMDLSEGDMSVQLPGVQLDRLFQVGDGQVELSALESYEPAIGQKGVAEPTCSIVLERLAKIGFGCVEE